MDMAPIAPMLRVHDIDEAIKTYEAIGFQVGMTMPGTTWPKVKVL